jgi:DeoR/GlpR family transcriptional regulator of sugar metabolism
MIPAQRRRDILKDIAAEGSGSVVELSHRYGVSEMTIRRDLKTLEEEGHVQYTRGGALAVQGEALQPEPLFAAKKLQNIAQKTRIARYAAAHFVEHNDIVILESGTTVTAMVQYMVEKRNLTVVTNGLNTTNELRVLLPEANVICTGGILRDVSFTFVGPVAERFFQEFYARKLFLSGIGFTLDAGVTDPQMIDTQVKKAMIGAADQVILLVDSSKFGVKSFTPVIAAYDIDVLITDDGAPASMLEDLRRHGVEVHVVSAP